MALIFFDGRTLLAFMLLLLANATGLGQEQSKGPDKSAAATSLFGTRLQSDVSRDVGSFSPSSTFLGRVVHADDGTPVGTIADIVIDPYIGVATTLVVAPDAAQRTGDRYLVPMQLVTPIRLRRFEVMAHVEKIANGPTIGWGRNARPYRRQLAAVPFDYYQIDPPWTASADDHEHALDDEDLFVYVRALRGTPVVDAQREKVGIIEDLAVSWANGAIAYAIISTTDSAAASPDTQAAGRTSSNRHAVPLGAFVVKADWQAWVIELPGKLLSETSAVPMHREWPSKVSLAWSKYVRERYGDAGLSGVQRKLADE